MTTCLDPIHPLQSTVIELLASTPGLDVQSIHRALQDRAVEASLPNLYRLVRQLTSAQVLSRADNKYYLNRIWIANVAELIRTADARHATAQRGGVLPAKTGQTVSHTAASLQALDPVWNDLLGTVAEMGGTKQWYFYNAHPWYSLGTRETEYRLFRGLTARGIQLNIAYGAQSFLDNYGAKLIRLRGVKSRTCSRPLFPGIGYIVWVCDDYVIECEIPRPVAQLFQFHFDHVVTIEDFDPAQFSDLFRMHSHCKLTVRRDPAEAKQLVAKIRSAVNA
jgi:hypothetical protein